MAQHDYVIANGTGAAVRSDLNNALAAIVTQNSGATEPATMYAYQWWADTTTGLLKLRNGANNAWITLRELDGTLTIEDGTASSPGLAFADDLNTGIYSPSADQLGITTGGTVRLTTTTTGITSALPVDVPLGSASAPTVTFTGDLNTGIYSPGADQVAISTGGTGRLFVSSAGLVGIGTGSPSGLLTLAWNSSTGINAGLIGQVSNSAGANNGYRIGLRTSTDTTNWCSIDQAFTNLGVNADTYIAFTTTSASNTAAERMRLTSTGLGIGTTSPGEKLHVAGDGVRIDRTGGDPYIDFYTSGSANNVQLYGGASTGFRVFVGGSERTRVDSSGRLLVGTSTATQGGASNFSVILADFTSQFGLALCSTQTTGTANFSQFVYNGTINGSISSNGTTTTYATTSDYRLKENVIPIFNGIARFKQLKPSRFNFIGHPENTVDGFLAHEVQQVIPEAVVGEKDATNEDGTIKPQGIDQSKLVPLLTAALQEAIARIETLEVRLTAAGIE